MSDQLEPGLRELPDPQLHRPRRWSLSLVWLVPGIAALAALVLAVRGYLAAGPSITIEFKTAEGIEAGKTEVRFKEVPIGKVRRTQLSEDGKRVVVRIDLINDAERVAVEDSRFWVVRPRVGLGGVSGLGTLISGAYIGVDVGRSTTERFEFVGLETPPPVTNDQEGRRFLISSADLGSLDIGSPVYYRRIQVGRVVGYDLEADGKSVTLQVFVDRPYDRFVTTRTRFWNASGVDVQIGAAGLKLNTQSLATVIAGGLAFQSVPEEAPGAAAPPDSRFVLFEDRVAALAPSEAESLRLRLRFDQSTRGLAVDAPVDLQGVEVGRVRAVALDYDRSQRDFWSDVLIDVYPEKLGRAFEGWQRNTQREPKTPETFFRALVERGLRAQLRTANLITGQLYVALDFDPKAGKLVPAADATPLEIPTSRGDFDQIQEQIISIIGKIEQVPFDDLGRELRDSLQSASQLLRQLDGQLAPELRQAVEEAQRTLAAATDLLSDDSGLQRDARRSFTELERASRSLRALADYLQRHPDSLIRGRREQPEPAPLPLPDPAGAAPPAAAPETP